MSDLKLAEFLRDTVQAAISAYRTQPSRIEEDANQEADVTSGGYVNRQLYELIQNGADQIQEAASSGNVSVVWTRSHLYCANQGAGFTEEGIRALLQMHLSPKKGGQIGRFGIGFKSVLKCCEQPEVFSKSVSFRFNPPTLLEEMKLLCRGLDSYPKMRTAELIETEHETGIDPVLRGLLAEHETVIRLKLLDGEGGHLQDLLKSFPAEFLLFSPHVRQLQFQGSDVNRQMRAERNGSLISIHEGQNSTDWHVFQRDVPVDGLPAAALSEMGDALKRALKRGGPKTLPVVWAAPVHGSKREAGEFWAFFPTRDQMTLQGILNAPWKTDAAREHLQEGEFNRELLRHAAELVSESLPELNTPDDPVRFLDALPARDSKGWADKLLGEVVVEQLKSMTCLATRRGDLVIPYQIRLLPQIAAEEHVAALLNELQAWMPEDIGHPLISGAYRAPRAERIGAKVISLDELVEGILSEPTPERSIAAIRLVDTLLSSGSLPKKDADMLKMTAFVLTKQGTLEIPDVEILAFASDDDDANQAHQHIVHPVIASHAEARRILEKRFKIPPADMSGAFRALLASSTDDVGFWEEFWRLSRKIEMETVVEIITSDWHKAIKAKTLDGSFKAIGNVLLPGSIVDEIPRGGAEAVAVDTNHHSEDIELLKLLGAEGGPAEVRKEVSRFLGTCQIEADHRTWAVKQFQQDCVNRGVGRKPQVGGIDFKKSYPVTSADIIQLLSDIPATKLTRCLLELPAVKRNWIVHTTARTPYVTYGELPLPSPTVWALRRYGWVETSLGPRKCKEAVGPALGLWGAFLPVANCSAEDAKLLKLVATEEGLTSTHFDPAIRASLAFTGDVTDLTKFYALAAGKVTVPETIRCRLGDAWSVAEPASVTITCDPGGTRELVNEKIPWLLAPNSDISQTLREKWNLLAETPKPIGFDPADDPELAIHRFPALRGVVEFPQDLQLQPCTRLWIETVEAGNEASRLEVDSELRNECLSYLESRDEEDWLIQEILKFFPRISAGDQGRVRRESNWARLNELRETIRQASTIEEKLLKTFGEDRLRKRIHQRHLDWLDQQPDPSAIKAAQLAHACFGAAVLREYRSDLEELGLNPPGWWNGGEKTVAFVEGLGFPGDYAGSAESSRDPFVDTIGPVTLKDLHDYQKQMRDRILASLCAPQPQRGMLSLPTGAGKTRVAVQSLIEWFKSQPFKVPERPGSVLWIAEGDELCEQAVRCWQQAWRALGPENREVRINRLWGSTNDRIMPPESHVASVVVATEKTLVNRLDREELDWVFSPDVVVIDEAHHGTTKTFTKILNQLGLEKEKSARPLLGLTATPFRGKEDVRESLRLAFRFSFTRFDLDDFMGVDLYQKLQNDRVLAMVDHEELPGTDLELTPSELANLATTPHFLPPGVEERLGRDLDRNNLILDHIHQQPPDWPILLFATSVEHAEDIAVRLSMRGISAQAISSNTQTGQRRFAIKEFQAGKIRVLTNYGVLTTGFDAPSVRAVYVTRPVFSRLLYQQMIGRGLRGPQNGGKERCLIVNVADNIAQFGHALAFREFDFLWSRPGK